MVEWSMEGDVAWGKRKKRALAGGRGLYPALAVVLRYFLQCNDDDWEPPLDLAASANDRQLLFEQELGPSIAQYEYYAKLFRSYCGRDDFDILDLDICRLQSGVHWAGGLGGGWAGGWNYGTEASPRGNGAGRVAYTASGMARDVGIRLYYFQQIQQISGRGVRDS